MITAKKVQNIEFYASDAITVPHAFTTRLGGVSTGVHAGLNLAMHRGDTDANVLCNHRLLADALGYETDCVVMTHQTHSDIVRVVTRADCAGVDHHVYPECDALVTDERDLALVVFTADCTPLLFHDPVTGAVGAAHAGWRGTAADIGAKTVEAMVGAFGSDPANIRAAVGPNIGACCFETGEDVPKAMRDAYGSAAEAWITAINGKYYVNLKEINALSLRRAGVRTVDISDVCTMCSHDHFWSHRYTHGERGSQGAVIVCKGGCA